MTGIVGVIGAYPPQKAHRLVETMLDHMTPPADLGAHGIHSNSSLGVCAGWSHAAGTFAAQQCMHTGANGRTLLFCGEARVSATPIAAGREGTAPLDAAVDAAGDDTTAFVSSLNGLFSGLLVDSARATVNLFNDRFGSERLYVHAQGGLLYFASEVRALLAALPQLRVLDDQGVADFLAFGSVLEDRTLFRGISLLPGGSLWTTRGAAQPVERARYFDTAQWETQEPLEGTEFSSAFADLFRRTVPHYCDAEQRVGISLTGGLDTRMIMACLSAERTPSVAYTYAGPTGETLDCRIGAQVAGARGIEHHTLRVGPDFLRDYGQYVDRTVTITGGCAGALGAHELAYASLARRLAPIRLTGNFGSEVLRSMSTFKPLGLAVDLIDGGARPMIAQALARNAVQKVHPVTHAAFREITWHLSGTLAAARSQLTFRTPYLDNEVVALAYRAPQASRSSPAAALALIAANDRKLAAIPTDRGLLAQEQGVRPAAWARRAYAEATFKLDYLDKEGMPGWATRFDRVVSSLSTFGLLGLHKFLPYRRWFRHELAPYLRDVAADAQAHGLPYWNPKFLATVVGNHVGGGYNHLRELNAIVTLEAVRRTLLCVPVSRTSISSVS